jgi:hypothetical protein
LLTALCIVEKAFATLDNTYIFNHKVHLTAADPNMSLFSNTSGSTPLILKHLPLGFSSATLYDLMRPFGRLIVCKSLKDRVGTFNYALLQFDLQQCAANCLSNLQDQETCIRFFGKSMYVEIITLNIANEFIDIQIGNSRNILNTYTKCQ